MRRHTLGLSLLIATLGLVCGFSASDILKELQTNIPTVKKGVVAARPLDDSEEYYVGQAVAARILATYPLVQDPRLTQYVNEVGLAVANKSACPKTLHGYHFAVLETPEVNAFACPGGIIFITRGALKTCENEDQLAAVLAHEVGHVANKDGIHSITQARLTEVVTTAWIDQVKKYGGVPGKLVALFEGSIDDVFKTIVVNGYSRSAEEAADREAVQTLTRAGYDPGAMAALLTKMLAKEKESSGGIFKTHPATSDRLAKVKSAIGKAAPSKEEAVRTKRFQMQKF